jgi:hypothetical protein
MTNSNLKKILLVTLSLAFVIGGYFLFIRTPSLVDSVGQVEHQRNDPSLLIKTSDPRPLASPTEVKRAPAAADQEPPHPFSPEASALTVPNDNDDLPAALLRSIPELQKATKLLERPLPESGELLKIYHTSVERFPLVRITQSRDGQNYTASVANEFLIIEKAEGFDREINIWCGKNKAKVVRRMKNIYLVQFATQDGSEYEDLVNDLRKQWPNSQIIPNVLTFPN